jgi:hypothetical protein
MEKPQLPCAAAFAAQQHISATTLIPSPTTTSIAILTKKARGPHFHKKASVMSLTVCSVAPGMADITGRTATRSLQPEAAQQHGGTVQRLPTVQLARGCQQYTH